MRKEKVFIDRDTENRIFVLFNQGCTVRQLVERLGISKSAIYSRLAKHQVCLSHIVKYTKEEKLFIACNYGSMSATEIADILCRKSKSIVIQASLMGVSKRRSCKRKSKWLA